MKIEIIFNHINKENPDHFNNYPKDFKEMHAFRQVFMGFHCEISTSVTAKVLASLFP